MPDGVQPSSFERVRGWHRQVDKRADGSVEVVRWHGELARDGVGRFAFVAATPERAGDLVWKAVQRYDDGSEAAWIGPRHSERPAPVTRVGVAAPRAASRRAAAAPRRSRSAARACCSARRGARASRGAAAGGRAPRPGDYSTVSVIFWSPRWIVQTIL